MPNTSLARSLKVFIDAITVGEKDQRSVRKIISDSYNISEDGSEMQFLLFVQLDNFERLLRNVGFSNIDNDAKATFRSQISLLSSLIKHPILYSRYDTHAASIIRSNAFALTYAHGALGMGYEIDEKVTEDIRQLVEQLELALDYLKGADLPLQIRGTLYSQISELIFLLKNLESVGLEKVWEVASSNLVTVQREAASIDGDKHSGPLKKAAIGASMLLAALTALLGTLEQGSKHAVGFAKNLKEGTELIEQWQRQSVPRIEHKRKESSEVEAKNI